MAAGSRDRPLMLATGRYAQWKSRFIRYIDTRPNGEALRKCILEGPYQPTTVIILDVPATVDSLAVPERTAVETILTMSLENKAHYESKKEAIHLLLTGIGDEIYSTVEACKTAHEMWIAIERLQQDESLNIQDVKTNLFWEFGKFNSHDGESMESYYSRFYKMMNEMIRNNLTVAMMQYQKEVNEILAERIAKNANPLSLIAKPIKPPSELAFEEDIDPEQAQRDKDMQKNLALISKYFKKIYKPTNNNLRTSSNSRSKNVDTSPRKPKRVKDLTYYKEKMLLCKQAKKGVLLQEEQTDWLEDTDEEIDEQELEAHYSFMAKIQEWKRLIVMSFCILILWIMMGQTAKHVLRMLMMKRVVLANLIANLKIDVDENKKIQKQLKKANTSYAHELKECKSILAETSRTLGESNSIRDSSLISL
ncbi:hypothetical protein Tco_0065656 [Tanacetum coccineum]